MQQCPPSFFLCLQMASVSPAITLKVVDDKAVEVLTKQEVQSPCPNQLHPESSPKSSQSDLALPELIHNTHEGSPTPDISISIIRERVYLATLCWCMFLMGWGAGSLGPLLPTIQVHYKVTPSSQNPNSLVLIILSNRLTIRCCRCFS